MAQKVRKTNQAIVIGGGVAGLACAARLSMNGLKVHLFEQNHTMGGKMNSFQANGFRFDTGPSLLTLPHTISQLFKRCGKRMQDYIELEKLEVVTKYFFADNSSLVAYSDPDKFADAVDKFAPGEGKNVLAYLRKSKFIYNKVGSLFLEQSLSDWRSFMNLKTLLAVIATPRLQIFKSLHQVNKKAFKDNRLVQLFDRFATYNGSDPFLAPGILQIIAHLEHERGAFIAKGGMHAVRNALVKLAQDLGVNLHLNAPVTEIIVNKGVAKGIKCNDMGHLADHVVCNVDINTVYGNLLKTKYVDKKFLNQPLSTSALIFYWGVRSKMEQFDLHNVIFSLNYEKEFEELRQQKPITDPTVYVYISSKYHQSDAPEGHSNLFVMINTPPNLKIDWEQYAKTIKPLLIKKIKQASGVDLTHLIVSENVVTPMHIAANTGAFQGALYGNSSNNLFAAFKRHPNKSKDVKNLYFIGGSVHPGGGVPLVLNSARIVAKMIETK